MCDFIVMNLCIVLIFSTLIDEVPINGSEAKLISEFVKSVASITTLEFQKENSTFGSLSGHEGEVSIVPPEWLKTSSSMIFVCSY